MGNFSDPQQLVDQAVRAIAGLVPRAVEVVGAALDSEYTTESLRAARDVLAQLVRLRQQAQSHELAELRAEVRALQAMQPKGKAR